MNALKWIGALVLAALAAVAVALAAGYPDLARMILGAMLNIRLWTFGMGMAVALVAMAFGPAVGCEHRGRLRVLQAAGVLAVVAAGLFAWRMPNHELVPVRYLALDNEVLAGDLYRPESSPPWPSVVMVHGSAPFRPMFYDVWAQWLAERGIAVLLSDKRGVGNSGGEFVSDNNGSIANLSLLAGDVVAGVRMLTQRDDIDADRMGLYAISQGGWTGVLAAREEPSIAFMVVNSGPTVSVGEEGVWSELRGDDETAAALSIEQAERRIATVRSAGYDPRPDLATLGIFALWQFGAEDNSIPSRKSAQVLDMLQAAGHDYQYRIYPEVGHILIGGPHASGPPWIDPQSWLDLEAWLTVRKLH